jgi:hypothetical protein
MVKGRAWNSGWLKVNTSPGMIVAAVTALITTTERLVQRHSLTVPPILATDSLVKSVSQRTTQAPHTPTGASNSMVMEATVSLKRLFST